MKQLTRISSDKKSNKYMKCNYITYLAEFQYLVFYISIKSAILKICLIIEEKNGLKFHVVFFNGVKFYYQTDLYYFLNLLFKEHK